MKRLLKYFGLFAFLPFWHLQKIIVRDTNIWVFGAWNGHRFSDNSKYLYTYIEKNQKHIRAVWLSRSNSEIEKVRALGGEAYKIRSFKAILLSLKAKWVFVSSGKRDVNYLFINGANKVHLWHGNPIKKIGLDDNLSSANGFFYSKIVNYMFPMAYEFNYGYMVSNSAIFTPLMKTAYNLTKDQILETGCPRNDVFFWSEKDSFNVSLRTKFSGCRIVYYLPTFRSGTSPKNIFTLEDYVAEEIEEFLEKENIVLVNKAHFVETNTTRNRTNKDSRIVNLSDGEVKRGINFMLKDADALITDYSSAYFDFLLTERPMIFAAFDLEEYKTKSRGLYFEYKDVIAGPLVRNWIELKGALTSIWHNEQMTALVKTKNGQYNKYHDSNNSQRVFETINKLSKRE